jgi:type II secretory pathway pseudopilin PulG
VYTNIRMRILHKTHAHHFEKGFSLIEVLVSLSIFIVVITMAIGSLMALIGANARTQNMQTVMTNLSYTLDSMTRELRTGTDYFCSASGTNLPSAGSTQQNCAPPAGGKAISFNEGGRSLTGSAASRRVGYRVANGAIERRLANGNWLPMTAPEVTVESMRIFVTGTSRTDTLSPTVTLYIEGYAGDDQDDTQARFDIQTSIVQQLLDI